MFTSPLRTTVFVCALLAPVSTSAQTAYVEGHVFDKQTGKPLSHANLRLEEVESFGPFPRLDVRTVSDSNGFYQFEVDSSPDWRVAIHAFCETRWGLVVGTILGHLRDGNIRRDIYLDADGRRIRKCLPPSP